MNPPRPTGRRKFQAGWMATLPRRAGMDLLGPMIGDQAAMADGVVGDGEFDHAEEDQARV